MMAECAVECEPCGRAHGRQADVHRAIIATRLPGSSPYGAVGSVHALLGGRSPTPHGPVAAVDPPPHGRLASQGTKCGMLLL